MTDRPTVLSALWGTTRRRVLVAAAGILVVAAVVTTVVVGSGGTRPVPDGEMPVLDDQFAASAPRPPDPSSTPASAPALPAYSGAPLWTFTMPDGVSDDELPEFAVTDSGFVLQGETEILGLDRTGKKVWSYATPGRNESTVQVTGSLVFVGYADPSQDRWPQPDVIVALDAATGTEVWRETEASHWSLTADTVYMSVCRGGQNDRIGDCTFSARDPRTNAVRWTAPTYASSRPVNTGGGLQAEPTPPVLLIESYPTGADSRDIAAHDPATGALRGRGFEVAGAESPSIDVATANTAVRIDDDDENPANGCTATLTGFSIAGADQLWQYTARTTKTDDGVRCSRLPISYTGPRLGITAPDGVPVVLNLDSGAVEWKAPESGVGMAVTGTTLLAVASDADGADELVAYRIGDPNPAWRASFGNELGDLDAWHVRGTGAAAVITSLAGEAVGFDLATGTGWSYGQDVAQDTATWFAVCRGVTCDGYATA